VLSKFFGVESKKSENSASLKKGFFTFSVLKEEIFFFRVEFHSKEFSERVDCAKN
jgi:hypothetical protein